MRMVVGISFDLINLSSNIVPFHVLTINFPSSHRIYPHLMYINLLANSVEEKKWSMSRYQPHNHHHHRFPNNIHYNIRDILAWWLERSGSNEHDQTKRKDTPLFPHYPASQISESLPSSAATLVVSYLPSPPRQTHRPLAEKQQQNRTS